MEQHKPFFTYSKLEIAIASILYVMCVSAILNNGHLAFANLLMVTTTYAGFLTLNFWVWPRFAVTRRYWQTILLTLSVFVLTGLAFMVFFSYQRSWEYRYQPSLAQANLSFFSYGYAMAFGFLLIYIVYVALREVIAYQHRLVKLTQDMSARIIREVILVASMWFGLMIPLFVIQHTGIFRLFFGPYFFALPYLIVSNYILYLHIDTDIV